MFYVKTNFDDLARVPANLPQAFDDVSQVVDKFINDLTNEFLDEIRVPGEEASYPINWDSDKQRRAFFATKGFGHGIPFQRTGDLENAWIKNAIEQGYVIVNPVDIAFHVYGTLDGTYQSRIHAGRWEKFSQKIAGLLQRWTNIPHMIAADVAEAFRKAIVK
jgi:hypothetical protein